MGVQVGRIVKEFVFKNLVEQKVELRLRGHRKELAGPAVDIQESFIVIEVREGSPDKFRVDETVRVYFLFQNNYHTFEARILEKPEGRVKLSHPDGVYKNPQRKYERVQMEEEAEVYFTLHGGQRVELNFPKTSRYVALSPDEIARRMDFDSSSIQSLHRSFRERMKEAVSQARIIMLRDKAPERYEERIMAATGKMLWIPSTEEDFPVQDPFPEERIVTRRELVKYEEALDRPSYVISSKLGNILYEKQKKLIHSELYCPVLYETYMVGYLYLCNREGRKERIDKSLVEYAYDFSRVLGYSLQINGYFSTGVSAARRFEAPIIDISASGLMFAHRREDLSRDLLIHTDMDITVKFRDRKMVIGSRVRRKFQDAQRSYFGVQFLRINQEDLNFMFAKLYGRPYTVEEENRWEGGTPPPPLDLFGQGS
jgi:hypothetical protein